VQTLDRLRASIPARHTESDDTESDDIVVLGYSQGAAVALALALAASSGWRPTAVVALAAWLPHEPGLDWDLTAAEHAHLRVLLVHGTHDEVVPAAQGRSAHRLLARHGIETSYRELETAHQLAPLAEAAREWLGLDPSR
jgi:phospholipase/carboxylesterase